MRLLGPNNMGWVGFDNKGIHGQDAAYLRSPRTDCAFYRRRNFNDWQVKYGEPEAEQVVLLGSKREMLEENVY
jgi:hypothetical protein